MSSSTKLTACATSTRKATRSPTIREAIGQRPEVLLTATPLQNSLMELYGLVTFIDPHIFGSEANFRDQYSIRGDQLSQNQLQSLRSRINPVCQRTFRRQVTEYIRFTKRIHHSGFHPDRRRDPPV